MKRNQSALNNFHSLVASWFAESIGTPTDLQMLTWLRISAGEHLSPIGVGVTSGDTPQSERRRMLREPPEILITTPESLDLLLSSQGGRSMLTNIRTVILDEIHAVVIEMLAGRYSGSKLRELRSYVRKDQRAESDLDLLIGFRKSPSLLQFIELEDYLSDLLGIRVDLVMEDTLKRRIGKRILQELITL
ncbi:MAG: DEAD/DEAH box helicase [Syntrophobacteraceae bacterium]